MCGIFGYVGKRTAEPILLEGLRTLEYRGYDSAGMFIPKFGAVKAVGPIDNLAKKLTETVSGTSGIAHTRWATHGEPSERNAHPHQSASEQIWLVHNGIIENYHELREWLKESGAKFVSDTDTEVLATLIGSHYEGDLLKAVQTAIKEVRGTFGIAVMAADDPETIVVARLGSPIVLGLGKDGNFVASDPSALLVHTKDVVYLDDGEIAVLTKDDYEVISPQGEHTHKPAETIEWDMEAVQKQGYDHFLIKEIMEIPTTIENTIRGRLIPDKGRAKLGGLETVLDKLAKLNRLTLVGCGSASYAAQVGKYIIEEHARIPVDVELASEYRYKQNIPDPSSAVMAITQSGETADTLAAVRLAQEMGLLTLGVVNVVGSTIARETEAGVYNHAGPEISVASSKAMVSQIVVLILVLLLIGRERGVTQAEGKAIAKALTDLPQQVQAVLAQHEQVKKLAEKYASYKDFMYIGRHAHAPVACEGSLKLKEVTYVHAEAYPGGELKHGPIALLDENFPLFAIAPEDHVFEKMVSNIEEVKARRAPIIAVTTEGVRGVEQLVDDVIYVPKAHPVTQPIVSIIPTYLFAYYVGVAKGFNVDRPRNLAKSVTVE